MKENTQSLDNYLNYSNKFFSSKNINHSIDIKSDENSPRLDIGLKENDDSFLQCIVVIQYKSFFFNSNNRQNLKRIMQHCLQENEIDK